MDRQDAPSGRDWLRWFEEMRGMGACLCEGQAIEAACAELDRLRADAVESDALRAKMAGILSRTAVALRGPEPPLTRWGWHDLPDRAAAAIAAIDVMQRAAATAARDATPNASGKPTDAAGGRSD